MKIGINGIKTERPEKIIVQNKVSPKLLSLLGSNITP